jgi:hypothetical protein
MALPAVSKETLEEMLAKIGLNEEKLKEAVKVMKAWLKQQPHLPNEFGKEIAVKLLLAVSITIIDHSGECNVF